MSRILNIRLLSIGFKKNNSNLTYSLPCFHYPLFFWINWATGRPEQYNVVVLCFLLPYVNNISWRIHLQPLNGILLLVSWNIFSFISSTIDRYFFSSKLRFCRFSYSNSIKIYTDMLPKIPIKMRKSWIAVCSSQLSFISK